jgi:hypothetical protein
MGFDGLKIQTHSGEASRLPHFAHVRAGYIPAGVIAASSLA